MAPAARISLILAGCCLWQTAFPSPAVAQRNKQPASGQIAGAGRKGSIGLTGSFGGGPGSVTMGMGGGMGLGGGIGGMSGGFFFGPPTDAKPANAAEALKPDTLTPDFTFEQVVQLITQGKITRLEKLLPALPVELRKNFVLMAESKSSHQASKHLPRVILCSPTARLMLAYSTAPRDENRHSLEAIQWREETESFEFREIVFDGHGRKPAEISAPNPDRCAACHGTSLRPNWEPASIWPGAIGKGTHWAPGEIDSAHAIMQRSDPRLKALAWQRPQGAAETPALLMSRHLNVLNGRRTSKFIRESRDYDLYKYAIVAGLLGLPEYLDIEPIRTAYLEQPSDYTSKLNETRTTLTKLLEQYYSSEDGTAIASLRFSFEPRKVSLADVGTSFRSPYLITGAAKTDFGAVVQQLYEADLQLRQVAPLPQSLETLWQPGPEREQLVNKLKRAGFNAWDRRLAVKGP